MDMLEGLYTRVPDRSSTIFVGGIDDASAGLSPEYKDMLDKVMAQKTCVGGAVILFGSVVGHNLLNNPDFRLVYPEKKYLEGNMWEINLIVFELSLIHI